MGLGELLTVQGDVLTHAQLGKAGVPAGRIAVDWVRVGPGAYVPRETHEQLDGARRTAATVQAARLVSGADLVAVEVTAALVHGLPVFGRLPVRPQLVERKSDRPRHHGRSRTVEAQDVDFADGRSESPLESVGRVRFHQHGLVVPDLQVVLHDEDGVIGRADHYCEATRTVGEADGALEYASSQDLFADKLREDRFRDAGHEVVRYTWDETVHRPAVVVARLLRAFHRSLRRAA